MATPRHDDLWLPDVCRLPLLAAMLGLAELSVVVVALAPDGASGWDLVAFLNASGYALWLGLSVSVLLAAAVAMVASSIVHALFASVGGAGRAAVGRVALHRRQRDDRRTADGIGAALFLRHRPLAGAGRRACACGD